MFRNCKPQCKFNQMGPLWAWWADISSKMLPKAGGRPGEDRGKTGARPGDGRGGHGGHFRSKLQPMFACQSAFIFFATSIVFVMYF